MALIYDNTISTAVTQVDIDLTLAPIVKGELYEMVTTLVNGTASNVNYGLYANDNNTDSSYWWQRYTVFGTADDALRLSRSNIAFNFGSENCISKVYIKLTNDGKYTLITNYTTRYGTSNITLETSVTTSTFTLSSVTKLSIIANTTNGIGINSRIQLYKVAEKVQDIEVGTSVTQVDITETIEKGNEYLLVSDVNNTAGSTSNVALYVNSDDTATNYDYQRLFANNTAVGGSRANANIVAFNGVGKKMLNVIKIKLTNSGIFNYQADSIQDYGTSGLFLVKYYNSKRATITNITELSIKSTNIANAIGIGSRFELYKLI